jgi:predicted acyl esterase
MANRSVKKEYKIGDSAWIYGVTTGPGYNRLTEGTVVHVMDIEGYSDTHYVVAISNGIEDLLEVRTWQCMSQDKKGPVGSFRELLMNRHAEQKVLMRTGMRLPEVELNPDFLEDDLADPIQD